MATFQESQDEQALPGSDKMFRSLFEQAATGIAVTSVLGRFLRVNGALCRMTGYSEQELLEKTFQEITHLDDIESNDSFRRQFVSGETATHTFEKRYVRKDGSTIWVQLVLTLARDSSGAPSCCISVVHDITGLRQAQEALQDSETRFRRMVAMSSDWYWKQDEQFRFVELSGPDNANFNAEAPLGRTRWEVPGLGALPPKVWERHRATLERHEPFSDFVFLRRDTFGELRYMSVTGEPLFDRQGAFIGYHGIGKDVTEQVRAQKALEASERRYRMLFDVHPHPMWVTDSKTLAFLAVNESALKHYGYSREEFLAMTADQIRPSENVSDLLKAFQDQSQAYRQRVFRHRKKNGEVIDVMIDSFNLEFDGRPARLAVATDITDRAKAEARAAEIEERYQALLKGRNGPASP